MNDHQLKDYTNLDFIKKRLMIQNLFKRNNWPVIDVTENPSKKQQHQF